MEGAQGWLTKKKLSTKVLLTCIRVCAKAAYLLYHKNTNVFRTSSSLQYFSEQISTTNLATLRDLKISPFPNRAVEYRRTELVKYNIHQEEIWDCSGRGYFARDEAVLISSYLGQLHEWTFDLPTLLKNVKEITIYASSPFTFKGHEALPWYI